MQLFRNYFNPSLFIILQPVLNPVVEGHKFATVTVRN